MDLKKRIFSGVCALSILTLGTPVFAETTEAVESVPEDKAGIHSRMKYRCNTDFSSIEELTDEQKAELTGLQTELKGYMEKGKEVHSKMTELMKEYGVDATVTKNDNSRVRGKMGDFFDLENCENLTDEQKATIEVLQNELKEIQESKKEFNKKSENGEKVSLTEEQKASLEKLQTSEKEINAEIKSLLEEYGVKIDSKVAKSENMNGNRRTSSKNATTESDN